jgi:hypothetical protein
MIRNYDIWQDFEKKLKKMEKVNIRQNFAIMNAMYKEAVALKILPLKNLLAGLEIKIKIAKAVNSVPKASHKIS